jgi:hypothetical protein
MKIRLKMVRRPVPRLLFATLFVLVATVAVVPSASADPRCTGAISSSPSSNSDSTVGFFYADGTGGGLRPGQSARGNERTPIVKFYIAASDRAWIDYYDLRTGSYITTHTVLTGVYDKDPCHRTVVLTRSRL